MVREKGENEIAMADLLDYRLELRFSTVSRVLIKVLCACPITCFNSCWIELYAHNEVVLTGSSTGV